MPRWRHFLLLRRPLTVDIIIAERPEISITSVAAFTTLCLLSLAVHFEVQNAYTLIVQYG